MYLEQQLGELSELLAACKETSLAAAQEAVRLTAQAIGAVSYTHLTLPTNRECGNGGSAATASHIANDLSCHMKNWQRDAYRIVCLNDSPAVLTSMTNDYGFEHVFEKPLLGLADAGDVLWGFSTSGNSGNVVAAVEAARAHNILTVGFTGKRGGKLRDLVDVWVPTPSDDVIQVENLHLILAHAIAVSVEAIVSPMQK